MAAALAAPGDVTVSRRRGHRARNDGIGPLGPRPCQPEARRLSRGRHDPTFGNELLEEQRRRSLGAGGHGADRPNIGTGSGRLQPERASISIDGTVLFSAQGDSGDSGAVEERPSIQRRPPPPGSRTSTSGRPAPIPSQLAAVGGALYFSADDGVHGVEALAQRAAVRRRLDRPGRGPQHDSRPPASFFVPRPSSPMSAARSCSGPTTTSTAPSCSRARAPTTTRPRWWRT